MELDGFSRTEINERARESEKRDQMVRMSDLAVHSPKK